jgi:hypothetical protein
VIEKVAHGDVLHPGIEIRCAGQRRETDGGKHLLIEAEPSLFDERENRERGERLGVARDAKERIRLHRLIGLDVAQAVSAGEDKAAVEGYRELGTGTVELRHQSGRRRIKTVGPGQGRAGHEGTGGLGLERQGGEPQ